MQFLANLSFPIMFRLFIETTNQSAREHDRLRLRAKFCRNRTGFNYYVLGYIYRKSNDGEKAVGTTNPKTPGSLSRSVLIF